jgi:hypothetical protein
MEYLNLNGWLLFYWLNKFHNFIHHVTLQVSSACELRDFFSIRLFMKFKIFKCNLSYPYFSVRLEFDRKVETKFLIFSLHRKFETTSLTSYTLQKIGNLKNLIKEQNLDFYQINQESEENQSQVSLFWKLGKWLDQESR